MAALTRLNSWHIGTPEAEKEENRALVRIARVPMEESHTAHCAELAEHMEAHGGFLSTVRDEIMAHVEADVPYAYFYVMDLDREYEDSLPKGNMLDGWQKRPNACAWDVYGDIVTDYWEQSEEFAAYIADMEDGYAEMLELGFEREMAAERDAAAYWDEGPAHLRGTDDPRGA
jgi:hypothetical protein